MVAEQMELERQVCSLPCPAPLLTVLECQVLAGSRERTVISMKDAVPVSELDEAEGQAEDSKEWIEEMKADAQKKKEEKRKAEEEVDISLVGHSALFSSFIGVIFCATYSILTKGVQRRGCRGGDRAGG